MHPAVTKLLSISSCPLGDASEAGDFLDTWGRLGQELAEMYGARNGFYTFESALLVRPLQRDSAPLGLQEWNAPGLWKGDYTEPFADVLFFAEDLFGGQYCIRGDQVSDFEPETGCFKTSWPSLGAWAEEILSNFNFQTGYPLAHDWQIERGPLAPGVRLLPKIPFFCGGKYELTNLYAIEDVKGMLYRASVANQIRNVPDGSRIRFRVVDDGSKIEPKIGPENAS
jgi:hypothetical protein